VRNVLWILTLLLVLIMATQWGVPYGQTTREVEREGKVEMKREGGVHVVPGDILLVITFLLWAGYVVVTFRFFEIRMPVFAVFALLAIVLASVIRSRAWGPGLKELAQLGAYLVGGWLVFANCITTRRRLRATVDVFTLVVGGIVLIALCQYRIAAAGGSAFKVAGTFEDRNGLGAFFAFALPFVFAVALGEERPWQRFALVLVVALGVAVTLSGGALIAITVGLLFVAAMRSQKALLGVLVALVLALTVLPGTMSLPRHADVVVNSVAPYLNTNFLDARDRGDQGPEPMVDDLRDGGAVRYKRWFAATQLIRRTLRKTALGIGPGMYYEGVRPELAFVHDRRADTDSVRDFNINTVEPGTFNMYLVTCAEAGPLGLVALVWIGVLLLARSLRHRATSRDEYGKALALGSAGAVIGAALCGVFSNILVRGIALPFIFVALSGILWAKLPDTSGRAETPRRSD